MTKRGWRQLPLLPAAAHFLSLLPIGFLFPSTCIIVISHFARLSLKILMAEHPSCSPNLFSVNFQTRTLPLSLKNDFEISLCVTFNFEGRRLKYYCHSDCLFVFSQLKEKVSCLLLYLQRFIK